MPGILVHQAADLGWAALFFGGFARWTIRLSPPALVAIAPGWAVATSAFEYYAAPPRIQPWLRMQTPYWIGLLVWRPLPHTRCTSCCGIRPTPEQPSELPADARSRCPPAS